MTDHLQPFESDLILPSGTQIVIKSAIKSADDKILCPAHAVGMIIESPTDGSDNYRVRFPNDVEATVKRREFTVRKQLRQASLEESATVDIEQLYQYVIFRCIVGSQAYGLAHGDSDVDRRGIYLAPADLQWSLNGAPEQLENDERQETYWELQKFIVMALRANPNVLECLYTPLIETTTPLIDELLAMRSIFLSQFIYQTYNGYVLSQFKKLEQDLRTKGKPNWKHAMHLIRLLLSGITVLTEGFVMVRVEEYRDRLLAIRREQVSWQEMNAWRLSLHREFDQAFSETKLPIYPDYERANTFLIKARRSMLEHGH